MSILVNILAFVVAVGTLVTFHEFGHFWVARCLGVKVLRFSVGFGRPLWRRVAGADQTEYVIAAIPLGGYVKMLDEREGPVPQAEIGRAFNRQPVGTRIAIVAAGPLANILFAVLAYWLMFVIGVNGIRPVVGEVAPNSTAAQAGLQAGDEILAVGGETTSTWQSTSIALLEQALQSGVVALRVRRQSGDTGPIQLDLNDTRAVLGEGDLLDKMGITPWRPVLEPVIGDLVAGGAAERSGLSPGDRILRADAVPIETWSQWVEFVRAHPDQRIALEVERDGRRLELDLHTDAKRLEGETIGRIGAYPRVDREQMEGMRVTVRYGPFEAWGQALAKTWDISVLTLRVLWKLVTGEAALSNISGPVTIAEYAGVSALIGVSAFLGALALFSISIGILNLLPVPVLDGGHLLYYMVELIKGSPVSETTEAVGQRIGFALLAGLMALALYNDFARLLG
jgi:regulator of sigma E protease